ncbi:MAG: atypical hybrid histidine kinase [Elusimicrobia bacterium]|nr:MAG: atypical hybrid histidine kinase [Elusimicrobiota bacterium]
MPNPKLHILVVDDEPSNRLTLEERLKAEPGWDLAVTCVENGGAALEALRVGFYDLAFLDYRLPDMDGIKLLDQVRQLHPKTAVVMVSGMGSERLAVETMKRGAIDYLAASDLRTADLGRLLRRGLEMQVLQRENLELRQVNRMKDEFISSVSHELRTPLAVILGYAKSLEDGDLGSLTAPQKTAVSAIRRRGDGLLEMVNRLLAFKETTFSTQEVLLRPVDLAKFVRESSPPPPADAVSRGVLLEIVGPESGVWALVDPAKLKEALANILSNAYKFSPDAGVVTLTLSINAGREAWLKVVDRGRGIPPELIPHLFEAFGHSDSELTREISGLGLGLTLSKQIVGLHGGRLWIESEGSGRGSTATIALNLAEPDTPHLLVEQTSKADKKRLLVVEDNEDIVEIVRLFLAGFSENVELTTTLRGEEALELISHRRFDLLVLDILLPDMDGLEVLARVGRLAPEKRPPVLILSGHSEAARQAVSRGALDFLLKPFTKQAFLQKVLNGLGLERRGKARTL